MRPEPRSAELPTTATSPAAETPRASRRTFLGASIAASTVFSLPGIVRAESGAEKLRMAVIGCGGRGGGNLDAVLGEQVVAVCDVNAKTLAGALGKAPGAKGFGDYRRLYEELKPADYDAVVVSTTEHTHAFATLPAFREKKHVYCEKPLTHNVREARVVTEAAKRAGVATQMGTQIHADANYRRVVELVKVGAIGKVSDVHCWVGRAWGLQSPEDAKKYGDIIAVQDRPVGSTPIPEGLDWDLWLGPAPQRPFHEAYWPGPKWYRWWDFGSGTMSDLGSH